MNLNDLNNNFSHIVICKFHDQYYSAACPIKREYQLNSKVTSTTDCVAMEIKKETQAYISLNQKDNRLLSAKNIHVNEYSYGRI